MFCKNCGAEVANDAKFCGVCGSIISEPEKGTDNKTTQDKKKKGKSKKLIFGISAIAIVLIAIIAVVVVKVGEANRTINLNKYLVVETTGYNGYGNASVYVDWDAIEEKYGDKFKFTSKAKKEYGDLLKLTNPMAALKESVDISVDLRTELSNGDKLTYTWDIDLDVEEILNCKLKYENSTYKVSGLKETTTFDAFEDLKVTFSGMSPNGSVEIEYSGEELEQYYFSCDKAYGLKNGDVVTISIDSSNIDELVGSIGKVPAELSKEYTVEGLDEYVLSYDELTEDFITTVKTETEDIIYSYTAKNYSEESKIKDLKYEGYVMNHIKEASDYYGSYNELYIIYSATLTNSEGEFSPTTVYYPVKFANILKKDDSLSYENTPSIQGDFRIGDSWWSAFSSLGYINPLKCYMNIAGSSDEYEVEAGDGFEIYATYEIVKKSEDITDEYRTTVKTKTEGIINKYIKDNYEKESKVKDLKYMGEYLLISKSDDIDTVDTNKYVVVYSATVSNTDDEFKPTTVYFPVEYKGLMKLGNGEYIVYEETGIIGETNFEGSYYSTKGYIDGQEMYSDIVTSNRDNYTYEVSEGLEKFGK